VKAKAKLWLSVLFFGECQFCPKLVQIPLQNVILLNGFVEVHETGYFKTLEFGICLESHPMRDIPRLCVAFLTASPPSSAGISHLHQHYWLDNSVCALALLKIARHFPLCNAPIFQFLTPKILMSCHTQSSHEINTEAVSLLSPRMPWCLIN
jgi:hypothetical protein